MGTGLGVGLGVTVGDGDGLDVGDGLGEGVTLSVAVGDGVTLSVAVGVAEGDVLDEDEEGSAAEDGDDVQAETTAEMSRATMAKPTAASLVPDPVPAAVACTFMEPPHPSRSWRRRFPVLLQKPAPERQTRGRLLRCPRRLKAGPRKRRGP